MLHHFENDIKDSFSVCQLAEVSFSFHRYETLNYNRIIYVQEAFGQVLIDGMSFSFDGPKLFLIGKGQLYGYLEVGLQVRGYQLSFGDCFWEKAPESASNCKAVLFNNPADNQWLPVPETNVTELDFLFETLQKEFNTTEYVNKLDALAAYLKIIMIKIANINAESGAGFDSYEKRVYRRFIELVSQQYHSQHEVGAYALALNLSARQLTDICKRSTGKGAKQIINGHLTAEAKRSLQFSSKPVKEIAYQLHFSTAEQFSHFFKKHTNMSPQDYRMQFVNFGR